MIIINSKHGKIEYMLKAYRQKVSKVKQIEELRDRQYFEKPSVTKRKMKQKAKYLNSKNDTI